MKAVVFDLWDTLVDFSPDGAREVERQLAKRIGMDHDAFRDRWQASGTQRSVGPLAHSFRSLGVPEGMVDELIAIRHEATRKALRPRAGSVETLRELRRRGLLLGLVSVCSEEVALLWEETPFAGLFDSTVFSATCGLRKPDPEIYLLASRELGIDPGDALFVGDGANDELAGAERVGMQAVLIHRPGEEPFWPEVREWGGARITSIPAVLQLVDTPVSDTVS